jgi:hypothetical protein
MLRIYVVQMVQAVHLELILKFKTMVQLVHMGLILKNLLVEMVHVQWD